MVPLHLGSAAEFSTARAFLQQAGYNETNIRARVRCDSLLQLAEIPVIPGPADTLQLLVKLFLQGTACALAETEGRIPEDVLTTFLSLGLLSLTDSGSIYGTVLLTPTENFFCASDRFTTPEGEQRLIDEAVYPSSSPPTQRFLHFVPRDPARSVLEIGSGSGVCSLVAARDYGEQVWASDITQRSAEFAEFNRQLNGIQNMTSLQGDMYAAVEGMTFDRIIAHPPYVPVRKKKWVFYDGGEDGEAISRRVIEGLPRFLEPGGRCYCKTLGSDREIPFEQRVRQWLGEAQQEFDVLVVQWDEKSPTHFFGELSLDSEDSKEDFANWMQFTKSNNIRAFCNVLIAVQRRASERPVFTVRRYFSAKSDRASVQWLLNWQTAAMQQDPAAAILNCRPRAGRGVQLSFKHQHRDGQWTPVEFRIETEYPFANDGLLEHWMPTLFNYCNGSQTTEEIFARLKAEKLIHEATAPKAFAEMVSAFVARGFLEVDSFSLPAAKE
ncbi:MAG TPA: methyltransferase [Terriglobales bacterium]|nr:methyltransferase [Terriglobales bacterium]